jgi:hypothetical protein
MTDRENRTPEELMFPSGAREGEDALWRWFGLSYASWLTLPRVLMHAMPDDWQARMAKLLEEYDATWDTSQVDIGARVLGVKHGRMAKFPEWVSNYRHPYREDIEAIRRKP